MNALFSFGISFLIRLFAGLPAPGLSPGCFRVSPAAVFAVCNLKNKKCGLENRNYSISDTAGGLFCTEKGVCCLAVANPSG